MGQDKPETCQAMVGSKGVRKIDQGEWLSDSITIVDGCWLSISLEILRELRAACETEDGTDHQRKGTHLLEVLALEIQMYTETKNNKKLKVSNKACRYSLYL